MDFQPVENAFNEAVAQGVFPGAVVLVCKDEQIVFEKAFGYRSLLPQKTSDAVRYHLRSRLADQTAGDDRGDHAAGAREKDCALDDKLTRFIPMFGVFGKSLTTFRQLLNHSSGLPAWKPYYEEIVKSEKAGRINFVASRAAKSYVLEQIHREKPLSAPGAQALYSDLGFMVLAEAVETVSEQRLGPLLPGAHL